MSDNSHASKLTPDEVRSAVQHLSLRSFDLAKAVAGTGSSTHNQRESARHLDGELSNIWPAVDALPLDQRAEASAAWTDARLDLDYILSAGQLPTSTRLFHYLQELRKV